MTKPTMALAELAEKGADADLLREMIQFVAQPMMEMDVEGLCAAAYGERSPERANSRNGCRLDRHPERRLARPPSPASVVVPTREPVRESHDV
jgi:transposase-like protein